ncbi:MAG: dihydropteroate synthase, partial [Chloroflexia bacterium]|nr:dihydropteroate synthase [Chloroflexia bacterium]
MIYGTINCLYYYYRFLSTSQFVQGYKHQSGEVSKIPAGEIENLIRTEIADFLLERIKLAQSYNIDRIIVDPGIGFGKTLDHNLTILRHLRLFRELGHPLLLGVSRKSFIGTLTNQTNPSDRLFGTAAACTIGVSKGVDILRVHDPKAIKEVCAVAD